MRELRGCLRKSQLILENIKYWNLGLYYNHIVSSFFCHHTNNNWKLKIFTFCAIYALSSFGALPFYQNEKMKILINYISFSKVATEFTTVALKVTRLCHCVKTASLSNLRLFGIYLIFLFFFELELDVVSPTGFYSDIEWGGKRLLCLWKICNAFGCVAGGESFDSKDFLVM